MSEDRRPLETLPFIVEVPRALEEAIGGEQEFEVRHIPVQRLQEEMRRICEGVGQIFVDIRKVGNFRLTEVTLEVEVNAEGGVEFIGTAKVGGKGAITLKFQE